MTLYYVSKTGSDTANNGLSSETPLATVQAALNKAVAGDTVALRGGDTFRETVKPISSGTAGKPITITSYGTGRATISGLDAVSGKWETYAGKIVKSAIAPNGNLGLGRSQVFITDGGTRKMLIEARWPKVPPAKSLGDLESFKDYAISDSGSYNTASANSNGEYLGTYTDAALNFSENFWVGGAIFFLPGHGWSGQSGKVEASSTGTVKYRFALKTTSATAGASAYAPSAGNPFFLYGKLEALTQEGEFFIDSNNILYIYPFGGSLSGDSVVEVKTRDLGLDLKDRSYIAIENINIVGCRVIDSPISEGIQLRNISCDYGYHSAWDVNSAIRLRGNNSKILRSEIGNCAGNGIQIDGSNCEVREVVVYSCDHYGLSGVGIKTEKTATNITVADNSVFNVGGHGIQANALSSLFSNNRVWNFGRKVTDLAGINIYATGDRQGTKICYNIVHDGRAYLNSAMKYYGAALFRIDSGNVVEGVSNCTFAHNFGWNTTNDAVCLWGLKTNHTNYGSSGNKFVNNTIMGVVFLVERSDYSQGGTELRNNIAYSYSYGGNPSNVPSGLTLTNNFFVNNSLASNLSGDPGCISLENYNPMLQTGSPCVDAGCEVAPISTSSHIGAFETDRNPWVAGASIGAEDIAKLEFVQDWADPYKIIISGFPLGRGLPDAFQISVEGGTPSAKFYNIVDPANNSITAVAYLDRSNNGNKNLQISLDGTNFTKINKTADLGDLTIYSYSLETVNSTAKKLALTGRKFYTQNCYKIPIKVTGLDRGKMETPFLVKVNTASLIAKNLMRSDGGDLRILNADDVEMDYWIESGINTEETLVWVKSPANTSSAIQTFEDKSGIYLAFGNPNWKTTTGSIARVFPKIDSSTIAFWLKANECAGKDGDLVESWSGFGAKAIQSVQAKKPKLKKNQINGFSAIEFDGIDDFLFLGGNFTAASTGTFLVLYINPSPGSNRNQRLISSGSPGTADYTVGAGINASQDTAATLPNPTGATLAVAYSTPKDLTNIHIGVRHSTLGNAYKGAIASIIGLNRSTASAEQKEFINFWELKYALKRPAPIAVVDYAAMTSPIKVEVDNANCTDEQVVSFGRLSCVTPVSPGSGSVIKVTNPDGEIYSLKV